MPTGVEFMRLQSEENKKKCCDGLYCLRLDISPNKPGSCQPKVVTTTSTTTPLPPATLLPATNQITTKTGNLTACIEYLRSKGFRGRITDYGGNSTEGLGQGGEDGGMGIGGNATGGLGQSYEIGGIGRGGDGRGGTGIGGKGTGCKGRGGRGIGGIGVGGLGIGGPCGGFGINGTGIDGDGIDVQDGDDCPEDSEDNPPTEPESKVGDVNCEQGTRKQKFCQSFCSEHMLVPTF